MVNRRRCSAPLTDEDCAIWFDLAGPDRDPLKVRGWISAILNGDRRDAALMHTRTHRLAFGCPVCWEYIAHEGCTVDHEIRLRRPFHPDSLGAFLRDSLR